MITVIVLSGWNRTAQQCDGMMNELNGSSLLGYLYNVTFAGIQGHDVSFDRNGDPSGACKIKNLQKMKVDNMNMFQSVFGIQLIRKKP